MKQLPDASLLIKVVPARKAENVAIVGDASWCFTEGELSHAEGGGTRSWRGFLAIDTGGLVSEFRRRRRAGVTDIVCCRCLLVQISEPVYETCEQSNCSPSCTRDGFQRWHRSGWAKRRQR